MIQSHPFYKTVCCSAVCHYERDDQCYISTLCPLEWTVDFEGQPCMIFEFLLMLMLIQLRLMGKEWIKISSASSNLFSKKYINQCLIYFEPRKAYNAKGWALTIPLCGIKCGCILSIVNFAVLLIHQTCYLQSIYTR